MSTRRVAILIFDGVQSLDMTGPLEVFAIANRVRPGGAHPGYAVELIAPAAGVVTSNSGLRVIPDRSCYAVRGRLDTLLVAGGDVRAGLRDQRLLRWLGASAGRVRRLASVCTGSFLLAEAGLLRGRRATTHWASVDVLA